jgi:hypothetical protein
MVSPGSTLSPESLTPPRGLAQARRASLAYFGLVESADAVLASGECVTRCRGAPESAGLPVGDDGRADGTGDDARAGETSRRIVVAGLPGPGVDDGCTVGYGVLRVHAAKTVRAVRLGAAGFPRARERLTEALVADERRRALLVPPTRGAGGFLRHAHVLVAAKEALHTSVGARVPRVSRGRIGRATRCAPATGYDDGRPAIHEQGASIAEAARALLRRRARRSLR